MKSRKQAEALLNGAEFSEPVDPKVAMYANVARVIGPALQGLTFEPHARNFDDLEECIDAGTILRCRRQIDSLPAEVISDYDATTRQYLQSIGVAIKDDPFRNRIESGAYTFVSLEMSLLRTLAGAGRGTPLTTAAIYKSGRVLMPFAMTHLFHGHRIRDYTTEGIVNSQLRSAKIRVSPDEGVSLLERPELMPFSTKPGIPKQPRIGCPVTLLRGGLQALHIAAADAAISAGLLQVAHENSN